MIPALCATVLFAGLAWIVYEDIRAFRIPDAASLPLIAAGLLCAAFEGRLGSAAIGSALGYCLLVCLDWVYCWIRHRSGIGRGDAKLLAASGAWVGWQGLPMIILLASGLGLAMVLLLRRFDRPIPFGPFLAVATTAAWAVRSS